MKRIIELPPVSMGRYWDAVTDVPCPCGHGVIRWAEIGYVPGWRQCDGCGRHWIAMGDHEAPRLEAAVMIVKGGTPIAVPASEAGPNAGLYPRSCGPFGQEGERG